MLIPVFNCRSMIIFFVSVLLHDTKNLNVFFVCILTMANTNREVDVCSQCKTAFNDDLFLYVCCGVTMHISKKCTNFADEKIKGIIQGGLIILLVCSQCVFTKRRDATISKIPSQAQEGKIEKVFEEVNTFKSFDMEKLDLDDHDAMLT